MECWFRNLPPAADLENWRAGSMSIISPPIAPLDRRQSPTALAVSRGTQRLLVTLGLSCVAELPLLSGRRADLVALGGDGEIWIVEIKSSIEDFRTDQKWADYRMHCDRLFFATAEHVPLLADARHCCMRRRGKAAPRWRREAVRAPDRRCRRSRGFWRTLRWRGRGPRCASADAAGAGSPIRSRCDAGFQRAFLAALK